MVDEPVDGSDPVVRAFPELDRMSVGAFAREQETGRVLVDYDAALPLPPASNTKLITTALALDRLGPNYRFELRVRGTPNADPTSGRLDSVVLRSDRSPVVDRDDITQLAEAMRVSGVSAVGDIVLDVAEHDTQEYGPGWMWNDEQFYYGAKITPIAVSGNTVEVTISTVNSETGDGNSGVSVVPEPDSSVVDLSCGVVLVDEADETNETTEIEAFRRRGSNQIRIAGRIAPEETHCETLPVGDPLGHVGSVFEQALNRAGIAVEGEIRIVTEPLTSSEREHSEWSIESPPISEIVRTMNLPSDNFIAEQLALAVAGRGETGIGSWDDWETLVGEFLEARGVTGFRLRDGSGLSRYNRISARGLATVVDWAVDQPWGGTFLDSLPVAGRDGTLSDRLGDCEPTIRAKTGSLTGTRTLTGVIERKEKTDITFSAMISNLTGEHESRGKEYLDTFVRELVRSDTE